MRPGAGGRVGTGAQRPRYRRAAGTAQTKEDKRRQELETAHAVASEARPPQFRRHSSLLPADPAQPAPGLLRMRDGEARRRIARQGQCAVGDKGVRGHLRGRKRPGAHTDPGGLQVFFPSGGSLQ